MISDMTPKLFLISAYACEPNVGSEPGLGWNWAIELSKVHKVIIITRANNREVIEKVYTKGKYPNLTFEYCDVPRLLTFWKKGQRGLHLYYCMWQVFSYRIAKNICKRQEIDYSMALTFGNMWMPTFIYKLPCKFIWGPIGGGEGVPRELWPQISKKQKLFEQIRYLNKVIPLTNPWFYHICNKASLIIARTNDSLSCIPVKHRQKCMTMIETGISAYDIQHFDDITNDELLAEFENDFVCCGKMVSFKMFNLAIDAFEIALKNEAYKPKLHFIGDGPERKALEAMVNSKHIENYVIMHGKISREDTIKILASSKALLMTSAREGGSWVMFEAMLLRKPIVCFNTSGMGVVITSETGYMVPICTYPEAVDRFAAIVKGLIEGDDTKQIANRAYQRVTTEFLWSNKISQLLSRLGELQE
jgi:glycosyltransferase involved in cell wall biosynthesis